MYNLTLYFLTIAIWGSTWILAKFQVNETSAYQSVLYRFVIAAVILQGLISIIRTRSRHDLKTHILFFLLGSFLFCWNYVLFYNATALGLTTGLIAVIFSLIITMNIANNAILFREYPDRNTLIGAAIGIIGIALVFAEDIFAIKGTSIYWAILLCFIATYLASLGNMMSKILQRNGVSVTGSNGWGMTYGALSMLVFTGIYDQPFVFPTSFSFLASLVFLAVIGSVVAFWSYLTLLGRVGADRAAYAMIVFPIWALIISWLFEGFEWTLVKFLGVGIILVGNLFILKKN